MDGQQKNVNGDPNIDLSEKSHYFQKSFLRAFKRHRLRLSSYLSLWQGQSG